MDDDVLVIPEGIERLAKWTDRYDVIQGSRLDFDGGAFFWQYQLILSLGIPNPIAKWDLGPEGYRAMNQLCFEGGLFSRRVVDKIGLPDARFFIYGDDACYGYVASQHFPAAVVADVVLKRARAVSNWDIAGKRQLNSTSDTNRYYIMRNRGFLARYMQIYGDYRPILFRLGNAATFCKEFIRLAAVDKCFKTGIPALRRGMKDARKIIKDPNWKPMPPMKTRSSTPTTAGTPQPRVARQTQTPSAYDPHRVAARESCRCRRALCRAAPERPAALGPARPHRGQTSY